MRRPRAGGFAAMGHALRAIPRPAAAPAPEAEHGFVPPPGRWGGGRSPARKMRSRRLARDDQRLPETLAGPRSVAVARLLLRRARLAFTQSA